MLKLPVSKLRRYSIAVGSVGLVWLLLFLLDPWIRLVTSPMLALLSAVMITAWYGGTLPGLVAVVLSACSGGYLFLTQPGAVGLDLN
ncbi:MAG TPA: DUF4118 domain-containing protein, partial [Allocoleopsis sp.]